MQIAYNLRVVSLIYIIFSLLKSYIAFYTGVRKLSIVEQSELLARSKSRHFAYYRRAPSVKSSKVKTARVIDMSKTFYCYLLRSLNPRYKNYTYGGSTNDLKRRLRQHNGEITGGAKTTKGKGPWQYFMLLEGFSTYNEALSCEWRIKHPTNAKRRPTKYSGVEGRVISMNLVLNTTTWTSQSLGLNSSLPYKLHIENKLQHLLNYDFVAANVEIVDIALMLSQLIPKNSTDM